MSRQKNLVGATVILRALVGSRAYGTDTEESDTDERAVFRAPCESFFTVDDHGDPVSRGSFWDELPDKDVTAWELGKFVKLAIQCNPTALEVLWAPTNVLLLGGERLQGIRGAFLSRDRVYDAFAGYAKNQRAKMFDQPQVAWTRRNWKFAEAYLRVLYQGFRLLSEGYLPINFKNESEEFRLYLVSVKAGKVQPGAVIDLARAMEERMLSAKHGSKLPDKPDLETINTAVLNIRGVAP